MKRMLDYLTVVAIVQMARDIGTKKTVTETANAIWDQLRGE